MKAYLIAFPLCAMLVACASEQPKPLAGTFMPASSTTIVPTEPKATQAPPVMDTKALLKSPKATTASSHTKLTELQVDTDLSTVGAPLDWIQIFSAINFSSALSSRTLGHKQRVASFASEASLQADNLAHLKLVAEVPAAKKEGLAKEMTNRAASQLDFSANDLVVVYLANGGPPFGEYRSSMVDGSMEFCVDKAANSAASTGKTLKNIVKFYAAPKGLKVKMCER